MSTTNDTDIVKLSLNDTFYEWYLKTNQIIDYVNPINVYDVFAGSGLRESRTGTPGTVEFSLGTLPSLYAIDTVIDSDGDSTVILNIPELTTKSVSNTSVFVFSDGTNQSFKVFATNMLPPIIDGDHTFSGTITVKDLIVNDGTIVINNTGTNRDNSGIVVESPADGSTENASFTYDTNTIAWYSNKNLGLASGYSFVTDAGGSAIYPFFATNAQGVVDLQLKTSIASVPEIWSIKGEWGSPDTLSFAHYKNGSLIQEVLELQSDGTNGSKVIVKDAIEITDILSSSPFSTTPVASNVPITDSTNGFLNNFVNRVKLTNNDASIQAGHMVRMGSSGLVRAVANNEGNSAVLGIVESVSDGNSVVIISGPSTVLPRNTGGTQISPLTVGSVYYLAQTGNGAVTTTKPSSGVIKPIGIATTTSILTMIPDHVYSGLISNAFATIQVTDTGETVLASGSDTLSLVGGNYIDLDVNTNKQVIINSSILANQLIPSASNYSLYGKQTGNPIGIELDPYSIISRPLNGNLSSVVIQPGGLLGRKDDTDDSNNPVQSLNQNEVLDLLGFSGNNYFDNITFLTSGATTVHSFDASANESFNIKAGNNITFTYDSGSNSLVINSTGESTNNGGGGASPLTVSDTDTEVTTVANLIFSDKGFINFTVEDATSDSAVVYGDIDSNFLTFGTSANSAQFTAGKSVLINGNDGIEVTHNKTSGQNNQFIISLSDTLIFNESLSNNNNFVISLNEYEDYLSFTTLAPNDVDFTSGTLNSDVTEIYMKITHFDDINNASTRVSPADHYSAGNRLLDKCVSVYADYETGTDSYVSYPFKFHKIIATEIDVVDINITGTAIKNFAEITSLSGDVTSVTNLDDKSFNKLRISSGATQGTAFEFTDNTDFAYLIKLNNSYAAINSGFAISQKLAFTFDTTSFTPTIGWVSTPGTLEVESRSSQCQFKFLEFQDTKAGYVGLDNAGSYLKFSSTDNSETMSTLRIAQNSLIEKINSFSLLNSSNQGWKFETDNATSADVGKAMIVESVTNGVALVGKHFIVQPYTTNTVITNAHPINTLYYTV